MKRKFNFINSFLSFTEITLTLYLTFYFACAKPLPPPGELTATPDAAVSDVFTGLIADCSDLLAGDRTSKAAFWVQSCVGLEEGIDACMVKGSESFTKDALACLLIDMNVQWQRDLAMGLATPETISNSTKANRWFRDHQIGARR